MLTQTTLKSLLHYDPVTGIFTRLRGQGGRAVGTVAGSVKYNGYNVLKIDGHELGAHRAAFLWMTGSIPASVDHINCVRCDNRWRNLRESNAQGQCQNRSTAAGVTYHKRSKKWQAQIKHTGVSIYLGIYERRDAAVTVYENAKKQLHTVSPRGAL